RQEPCMTAHGDQFESEGMREQIVETQNAFGLFGAKISQRQQAGKPSPAGAVARIDQNVWRIVGKYEPRARVITQRQILLVFGQLRAPHARDTIPSVAAQA